MKSTFDDFSSFRNLKTQLKKLKTQGKVIKNDVFSESFGLNFEDEGLLVFAKRQGIF